MTSKKENCQEAVLQYMVTQNRPYSANDIMQNLHNEFGKTGIQKALDELTAQDKIREKVYGKQKVYCCRQESEGDPNNSGLALGLLDAKIEEATTKMKKLEQEVKTKEAELKALQEQPTTEDAAREIIQLEKTLSELREKTSNLSDVVVTCNEDEKVELKNAHEKVSKEYRKRKNICMNIVHSILENYPKKIKFLLEDIGIEVDDKDMVH